MTDHDPSAPESLEKRLPDKTQPVSAFSRFSRLVTFRSVAVAAIAALMSTGVALSVDEAPEARADDQSSLAGTSTIEGTVTDEDGVPLSRSEVVVSINLYRFVSTGTQLTSTIYNDESGSFSFTGLEPGSYTLCFRVSSWSGNLVRECWEDRPAGTATADRIELDVDQQVTGLRVALEDGTVRLTGPSITGRLAVGSTLSANASSATPTATLSYTWSRAGTVIPGANGPTLELTPADQGHAISVEVEASAPERITVWGESESVSSVRPGTLIWSQPMVSGVPVVGHTLTAVPGDWTPGTTFAFEWIVSRTGAVVGNGPTIALTRDFVENYSELEVTITGSIPGYTPVSATSEPTDWVSRGPAPVSTPTISGTPIVGSTLTASAATSSTDFAVQYEWFADGQPTASDGTRFFVLESWHVGNRISVRADAWGGGYISTTTPRSAETANVQPIPPVGVVSRISGRDRYASSVAISRSQFAPGVETVFIASGTDFPDALSGAPIAGHRGGPLLLTTRDSLPAAIVDELKRLRPKQAVIIGGTGAVSRNAESQVRALTAQGVAVRVAGSDRYATSVALSKMEFDGAACHRASHTSRTEQHSPTHSPARRWPDASTAPCSSHRPSPSQRSSRANSSG